MTYGPSISTRTSGLACVPLNNIVNLNQRRESLKRETAVEKSAALAHMVSERFDSVWEIYLKFHLDDGRTVDISRFP